MKTHRKRFVVSILVLLLTLVAGVFVSGAILTAPVHKSIGDPPIELSARAVQFQSQSGTTVHGWFIRERKAPALLF